MVFEPSGERLVTRQPHQRDIGTRRRGPGERGEGLAHRPKAGGTREEDPLQTHNINAFAPKFVRTILR
jgi:hypothetical protein